jgi:transcriptional regulator of NAD metabolism
MLKLKINPNFKKQIHNAITSSKKVKHTHRIIGRSLLINPKDKEEITKIFKRLELKFTN